MSSSTDKFSISIFTGFNLLFSFSVRLAWCYFTSFLCHLRFSWLGAYGPFYSLFDLRFWESALSAGFHRFSFMYSSARYSVLI
jgi:hypothetical protein